MKKRRRLFWLFDTDRNPALMSANDRTPPLTVREMLTITAMAALLVWLAWLIAAQGPKAAGSQGRHGTKATERTGR